MEELTWGPSGCCPQRATWPALPLGAEQVQICCRESLWRGRTVVYGRGWHSRPWRHQGQWHSRHGGTFLWHSGFLCAARVWSQHQERKGLQQGSRDRAERSGPGHKSGSLDLWVQQRVKNIICWPGISIIREEKEDRRSKTEHKSC